MSTVFGSFWNEVLEFFSQHLWLQFGVVLGGVVASIGGAILTPGPPSLAVASAGALFVLFGFCARFEWRDDQRSDVGLGSVFFFVLSFLLTITALVFLLISITRAVSPTEVLC